MDAPISVMRSVHSAPRVARRITHPLFWSAVLVTAILLDGVRCRAIAAVLELLEEPDVVIGKQTDVRNVVAAHTEPFHSQTECKTTHALRIITDRLQDMGIHH